MHLLFFSLLSFIGSISLFHFFRNQSKIPDLILFVVCYFISSILFWASAPLKESITVFGLGLFLWSGQPLNGIKRSSIRYGLMALALLTLIGVKLYVLLALIPGYWFWNSSQSKNKVALWSKFVLIHGLLFLFLISNQIVEALARKQLEFKKLIELSGANSAINIASFDSFLSLITALPQAIFNVLVQPIYPPNWGLFSLFVVVEHFIFLGLLLLPFIYKKQTSSAEQKLALFCISFVMMGSSIIGLTVPVLGGIVKYKVPFIPFYLIAILTFINFSKIAPKLK